MYYKVNCLLIVLFFVISSGCSIIDTTWPAIEAPIIDVPEEEINRQINLSVPEGMNTHRKYDVVRLFIENTSDSSIHFASDYGALLFVRQDNEWVNVANNMIYPEGSFIIPPLKNPDTDLGVTGVAPNLADYEGTVLLRIYLVGIIMDDDEQRTSGKTASFIDLELKP